MRCIAESQHKSPPCTPVKEKDQTSDSEAAKADVEIIESMEIWNSDTFTNNAVIGSDIRDGDEI